MMNFRPSVSASIVSAMTRLSFLQRNAVVLCLLLLSVASLPSAADTKPAKPPAKPLTALLLVAQGDLDDPYFGSSVVLVLNNLGDGPAGVIINRPTRIEVAELFPDNKRLSSVHDKVYFGGPVDLETVWFLVRTKIPPAHAILACDGVYISADKDLLLKLLAREHPMDGLRIFLGHSGWAPGQLQTEIARGSWKLKHASSAAIFGGTIEHPFPAPAPQNPTSSSTT